MKNGWSFMQSSVRICLVHEKWLVFYAAFHKDTLCSWKMAGLLCNHSWGHSLFMKNDWSFTQSSMRTLNAHEYKKKMVGIFSPKRFMQTVHCMCLFMTHGLFSLYQLHLCVYQQICMKICIRALWARYNYCDDVCTLSCPIFIIRNVIPISLLLYVKYND